MTLKFDDITTTLNTDTTTASISMEWSGGSGSYDVFVNGILVQSGTDNTFYRLYDTGDYSIVVNDGTDVISTVFDVPYFEPPYEVKHKSRLVSRFGNFIEVFILERDYTGAIEEADIRSGLEFDYTAMADDVFEPLKGSSMSMSLNSDTNFKFIDLLTSDDRKYIAYVAKNGTAFFKGWVTPNQYTERYESLPYASNVYARDGLGELSARKWLDENGDKFSGFLRMKDIVSDILATTDLPTQLWIATGFEQDTEGDALLNYISAELFYAKDEDITQSDVLEEILKSFGCQIQSLGNKWVITNKKLLGAGSIDYYVYSPNGTFIEIDTLDIHNIIGDETKILTESGDLLGYGALKDKLFTLDYQRKKKLNSDEFVINNTGLPFAGTWSNGNRQDEENVYPVSRAAGTGDFAIRSQLLQSTTFNGSLNLSGAQFQFYVDLEERTNVGSVFSIAFVIEAETFLGNTYYLDASGNWDTALQYAIFNGREYIEGTPINIVTDPPTNPVFLQVNVTAFTHIDTLNADSTIYMKDMRIGVAAQSDGSEYPLTNPITIDINDQNTTEGVEEEFLVGDLESNSTVDANIYNGGIRVYNSASGSEGTTTWKRINEATRLPLLEWLGEDYKLFKAAPSIGLNATLLSKDLNSLNTIEQTTQLPYRFMFNGGRYDAEKDEWQGEWLQITV